MKHTDELRQYALPRPLHNYSTTMCIIGVVRINCVRNGRWWEVQSADMTFDHYGTGRRNMEIGGKYGAVMSIDTKLSHYLRLVKTRGSFTGLYKSEHEHRLRWKVSTNVVVTP